jgi:two-component system, NarL family, nitrate/nitrite sensor histidine kinase NarX
MLANASIGNTRLGAKLALVAAPFLAVAFVAVLSTLWISWQLDGGAAAVNEAGRMRMQAYRLSLAVAGNDQTSVQSYVSEFERSIALLRHGDPERPLFVPWDDAVKSGFARIENQWRTFQTLASPGQPASAQTLAIASAEFVRSIDAWVVAIEHHLSRWTAFMHLLQIANLILGVLGVTALIYTGHRFVLEPVSELKQATEQVQSGDLSARVSVRGGDEFATLANGFNSMAEHLQSMYRNLESKVAEKTAQLEQKRARLEALYGVTALVAKATTLEQLARGFVDQLNSMTQADGVVLRWADEETKRYVMLASSGLSETMVRDEHCLIANTCQCAHPAAIGIRVIPIGSTPGLVRSHCAKAGYQTIVTLPVRHHALIKGEIDLLFHAQYELAEAERSLLEAVGTHLAAAMENIRLGAMEREAAVAQERTFIARELHDSIAQSLAFLKMQVELLRIAQRDGNEALVEQTVADIDVGVRESYADVRELLMHFRTRTAAEDIEPAIRTTLRKFEHQTGIAPELRIDGHGISLPSDVQLQVLHVIQEALSNVRKHAQATHVWVEVNRFPHWRFEVRDDGRGFDDETRASDETHVGLRIMRERAERIGAKLTITSRPNVGTSTVLELGAIAQEPDSSSMAANLGSQQFAMATL